MLFILLLVWFDDLSVVICLRAGGVCYLVDLVCVTAVCGVWVDVAGCLV